MRIQRLDPLVAQRIAAGEVIERPASVIRELVDNALDANASMITVSVEEGGLRQIKVIDDGIGIESDDLPLLCESHATSKVRELDDLYHITSMGFRGEALYSIAAVAKITIESSREGNVAHQITIDNGQRGPVVPGGPEKGTVVTVEELFGELPARRQFLKRPATEATMARQVLTQKALAFPDRHFRFYQDGKLRLDLPATTAKGRVVDVLKINQPVTEAELVELHHAGDRVSLYAVASTAALFRSDRSHIRIYINDRPVDEYALVQAVTYGYGEQLPGGSFPYCYLFIKIDPTLVDFNIHPTKREVKVRNQAEVHHLVVQMIRGQMQRTIPRITPKVESHGSAEDLFTEHTAQQAHSKPPSYTPQVSRTIDPQWFEKARQILGEERTHTSQRSEQSLVEPQSADQDFVYLGQAFNLFLIAQRGEEIYLVDQHAAHERLLFDEVRSKHVSQPLLVPLHFEVSPDVDEYLYQHTDLYLNLGIKVARSAEALVWELSAIPALYKSVEDEVVTFIQENTGDVQEVEKGLYAIIACHAAIRQGDRIDRHLAVELLQRVFALDEPVCPHGRTFVVRLAKDELIKAVGR